MQNSKMNIRRAKFEDLNSILALVKELAIYEKAPDAVWADLRDYQQAFRDQVFEAIVGETGNGIIGVCIYYLTWSTWKGRMLYLEDFIVKEAYRRGGFGQKLFEAFMERANELDCTLVKWQVLDWNEPALNFYKRNHATIEKDWWTGKILLKSNPERN